MLDLLKKNKEMLDAKAYKLADERTMLKIASLDNPNDYDLYLVACCLCNYPIEEKAEARELRMKYFLATNNGSIIGFEHPITDYKKTVTSVKCTNTGNVNKYGLYEYEININDKNLVSDLWESKNNNCLKYVDSKTDPNKLTISISRDQLDNFTKLLDRLMIQYDLDDIESGLFYKNKSENNLIDLSKLSLPFTPYDFQIEDATKIIKKKRVLLGHDMGCISGDAIVKIIVDNNITFITLADLYNKQPNNAKIESYEDNKFRFIPINTILDKGKRQVLKIITTNTYIKCTYDHEILTNTGWVPASNLNIGNIIISNTNKIEQIINIEYLDEEINVYDVAVDSFITSNFVANNLVVHNCGKTFISVLVGTSIGKNTKITYNTLDNLNYSDIVITDKGPLPIGKIVEENIDCKVQVTKNGKTKFVNILDRSCTTE